VVITLIGKNKRKVAMDERKYQAANTVLHFLLYSILGSTSSVERQMVYQGFPILFFCRLRRQREREMSGDTPSLLVPRTALAPAGAEPLHPENEKTLWYTGSVASMESFILAHDSLPVWKPGEKTKSASSRKACM